MTKWVYDFAEGSREMRELLGRQGRQRGRDERVLGAERVPAGFTITTEACVAYMREKTEPEGMEEQVDEALRRSRSTPASSSATRRTRCSCPSAPARASRCPG